MNTFRDRFAYAHDQGLYALACDEHASFYYGYSTDGVSGAWWRTKLYLSGWVKGLLAKSVPVHFLNARALRAIRAKKRHS
jgi:hypothetical protein